MKELRGSTGHTKSRQRFPKQEPRINTPRPGGEREEVELPKPRGQGYMAGVNTWPTGWGHEEDRLCQRHNPRPRRQGWGNTLASLSPTCLMSSQHSPLANSHWKLGTPEMQSAEVPSLAMQSKAEERQEMDLRLETLQPGRVIHLVSV